MAGRARKFDPDSFVLDKDEVVEYIERKDRLEEEIATASSV
jgi:uncharacterized protein (UPF0335 family)